MERERERRLLVLPQFATALLGGGSSSSVLDVAVPSVQLNISKLKYICISQRLLW